MKKKIVSLALSALLLVSCSSGGSLVSEPVSDSESRSKYYADLTAEDVRQAYRGADALEGVYFDKFTMPEIIEVPQFDRLYELTVNTVPAEYDKERLKKLFSDLVGGSFDPNCFIPLGNTTGYVYNSAGEQSFHCDYIGGGFKFFAPDADRSQGTQEVVWSGYVGVNGDQLLELGDVQTSVGQQTALFDKRLGDEFEGLFDQFDVQTEYMYAFGNGSIVAHCAFAFEGIPLQWMTTGLQQRINADALEYANLTKEYYASYGINAELAGGESWGMITTSSIPRLIDKKELSSVISLKRAVGILQSELDGSSIFNFCDVRLIYTGLVTDNRNINAPSDSQEEAFNSEPVTLVPMWCFFIESGGNPSDCIKVNAVNGDVIYDVS